MVTRVEELQLKVCLSKKVTVDCYFHLGFNLKITLNRNACNNVLIKIAVCLYLSNKTMVVTVRVEVVMNITLKVAPEEMVAFRETKMLGEGLVNLTLKENMRQVYFINVMNP